MTRPAVCPVTRNRRQRARRWRSVKRPARQAVHPPRKPSLEPASSVSKRRTRETVRAIDGRGDRGRKNRRSGRRSVPGLGHRVARARRQDRAPGRSPNGKSSARHPPRPPRRDPATLKTPRRLGSGRAHGPVCAMIVPAHPPAAGHAAPAGRIALRFAAAAGVVTDRHGLLPAFHGRRSRDIRGLSPARGHAPRRARAGGRRFLWRLLAPARPDTGHGGVATASRTRGRRLTATGATSSRALAPASSRCCRSGWAGYGSSSTATSAPGTTGCRARASVVLPNSRKR